jgi:hypothetical protein
LYFEKTKPYEKEMRILLATPLCFGFTSCMHVGMMGVGDGHHATAPDTDNDGAPFVGKVVRQAHHKNCCACSTLLHTNWFCGTWLSITAFAVQFVVRKSTELLPQKLCEIAFYPLAIGSYDGD